MRYPYECPKCGNSFDVIKSLSAIDDPELCSCGMLAERGIGKCSLIAVNEWVPSYNPAFGRVVKSKSHQREILKEYEHKGKTFEEIGNEPVDKLHSYFDTKREEKRNAVWNESTEKIMQEVLN